MWPERDAAAKGNIYIFFNFSSADWAAELGFFFFAFKALDYFGNDAKSHE